jgi:hypothetical protein
MLLLFALLPGCGKPVDGRVVEGHLRSGDRNYWLIDTTLVTIGTAQITGEPSRVGSAVRAEGHRLADGVFEATRITVGGVDPAQAAGSLPAATTTGTVEVVDAANNRWQVAGRQVQFPPGLVAPTTVRVGDRVAIAGYTLPDGTLLAANIAANGPEATATRAPSMPTATQVPVVVPPAAPAAPSEPAAPAPKPGDKPTKPKPKEKPGNDGGNGKAGGG